MAAISCRSLTFSLVLLSCVALTAQNEHKLPDFCPAPTAADLAQHKPFVSESWKKGILAFHANYARWNELTKKDLESYRNKPSILCSRISSLLSKLSANPENKATRIGLLFSYNQLREIYNMPVVYSVNEIDQKWFEKMKSKLFLEALLNAFGWGKNTNIQTKKPCQTMEFAFGKAFCIPEK